MQLCMVQKDKAYVYLGPYMLETMRKLCLVSRDAQSPSLNHPSSPSVSSVGELITHPCALIIYSTLFCAGIVLYHVSQHHISKAVTFGRARTSGATVNMPHAYPFIKSALISAPLSLTHAIHTATLRYAPPRTPIPSFPSETQRGPPKTDVTRRPPLSPTYNQSLALPTIPVPTRPVPTYLARGKLGPRDPAIWPFGVRGRESQLGFCSSLIGSAPVVLGWKGDGGIAWVGLGDGVRGGKMRGSGSVERERVLGLGIRCTGG